MAQSQSQSQSQSRRLAEPFWEWWAELEIKLGRVTITLFVVTGALVLTIALLVWLLIMAWQQTEMLSENRVMYGYPREDGVFVSVTERPDQIVENYAQRFVSNLFTYDSNSVQRNFQRVLEMYDYRKAQEAQQGLSERAAKARNGGISQLFVFGDGKLVEHQDRFVYTVTGSQYRYADKLEFSRSGVQVRVVLKKVSPTEGRPSGVAVMSVKEEPL